MEGTARPVRFFSQLLLILMGIVILYLVVDFGRQVVASHLQSADLQARVSKSQAVYQEQEELLRLLEYSRSDEVVEDWRKRHGLVKDNEVPVVTESDFEEPMSIGRESPEPVQASVSSRLLWWDLFFGQR